MKPPATLYIVGTPIGNLEDITLRALRLLTSVDVIVCEDTRVTRNLLSQLSGFEVQSSGAEVGTPHTPNHKPILVRSDEHTQLKMIPRIFNWLETGTSVALTTDAGMPTISDPGWKVIDAVRGAGYPIEVVPGPTALTAALAASGIEASKVWFVGFLPKKANHRQQVYTEIIRQIETGVSTAIAFYESPNRLRQTLDELRQLSANRQPLHVAACAELTKLYEKVIRGPVDEVIGNLPADIKGEWVVVIGGK